MGKAVLLSSSSSPIDGGRDSSLDPLQPTCDSLLLSSSGLRSRHKGSRIFFRGGTSDERDEILESHIIRSENVKDIC